jgi:hypothetical protein
MVKLPGRSRWAIRTLWASSPETGYNNSVKSKENFSERISAYGPLPSYILESSEFTGIPSFLSVHPASQPSHPLFSPLESQDLDLVREGPVAVSWGEKRGEGV